MRIARGPGRGVKRTTVSFQPVDYRGDEEQFAHDGGDHIVRIGDWHSHPDGDLEPSESDLQAWVNCFKVANEDRGATFHVGIIVSGNRERGLGTRLSAFCISRDERNRECILCEPADLDAAARY